MPLLSLHRALHRARPHSHFQFTFAPEKPVVKSGSDVWIKVQMTNTSWHDIDCTMAPSNGLDRNFQLDVRDNNGNLIKKIARKFS